MEERRVIDYGLRRRFVLQELAAGRISTAEVREADVYLLRAARFHGVETTEPCPLCNQTPLVEVAWIFGETLKQAAGSARSREEIEQFSRTVAEFTVHCVEVCQKCHWNHITRSFTTGLPPRPKRSRRRAT